MYEILYPGYGGLNLSLNAGVTVRKYRTSKKRRISVFVHRTLVIDPILSQIYSINIIKYSFLKIPVYKDADKSLARPGRKDPTATEDFEFHISYL
jgi:hypothetical protein